MRKKFVVFGLLLCSCINIGARQAYAGDSSGAPRCADLIKECFAYGDVERSNCFYASGNHAFCKGTGLGELALHRWGMSPVRRPGLESAPAFMGPTVVDGQCISNFDAQWSSTLVKGPVASASIKALEKVLDTCARPDSDKLMRP